MSPHGLTVAVTGGAGFIGSNLCAELCRHPRVGAVRVLDDLSTGSRDRLPSGVELVEADLLDERALDRLVLGADALVHLAARSSVPDSLRDPVGTYRVNGFGSALALDAARRAGVGLSVIASSAAVYGCSGRRPGGTAVAGGEVPARPVNPYGASKLAAEGYAMTGRAAFRAPVLVLRLFNVFGPGQLPADRDGAVVPKLLAAALADEPVPVHGDGTQTRDFVYVRDVCRLIVAAVVRGCPHDEPVDVGHGTGTSLRELLALIEQVLERPVRRRHQPPRAGDVHDSCADPRAMRRLFPAEESTPLAQALADTVDWLRRRRT